MSANRSLISPTSNSLLEQALRDKLKRRSEITGKLGELEPLAVRIGLIQNTLKPRFDSPQLALFAADHGLAVDGVCSNASGQPSTASLVQDLLGARLPVSVFARIQGLELSLIDCGLAAEMAPHERLMPRKIAHGTRNARVINTRRPFRYPGIRGVDSAQQYLALIDRLGWRYAFGRLEAKP